MPIRNYSSARNSYKNMKTNRLIPVFVIIAILLVVFLVFKFTGVVGGISESNYIQQRNQKLRSEASLALTAVQSLSSQGTSDSNSKLAQVRQYIHGIQVLNDMNVSLYGEAGRLYTQAELDTIYSLISEYETCLSSGTKVTEVLTSLRETVTNLRDKTMTFLDSN